MTEPQPALEDKYYSVKEVAQIFQVSELTVRLWINKGVNGRKLAATKFGKSWRVTRAAITDFGVARYGD